MCGTARVPELHFNEAAQTVIDAFGSVDAFTNKIIPVC